MEPESSLYLPDTTGVMALSGAVLFPGSLVPLYIFEPRYRVMLARALEAERMFALGFYEEGAEAPASVGGIGVIRACVQNPDGTSHLILQGVCRVRFDHWLQTDPYFIGKITPLPSESVAHEEAAPHMEKIRRLCQQMPLGEQPMSERLEAFLQEAKDPQIFTDVLSATLVSDPMEKPRLLEETNPIHRLKLLAACLASN